MAHVKVSHPIVFLALTLLVKCCQPVDIELMVGPRGLRV